MSLLGSRAGWLEKVVARPSASSERVKQDNGSDW